VPVRLGSTHSRAATAIAPQSPTSALVVLRLAAGIYAATVLRMGQRLPLREALRLGR
jgi:hypothetical protein